MNSHKITGSEKSHIVALQISNKAEKREVFEGLSKGVADFTIFVLTFQLQHEQMKNKMKIIRI